VTAPHGGGTPPLVSVVVPIFNTAPYLRESLDSALAQTWPCLEFVLMENCSTDGSGAIVAEYAGRDPRIRLTVNARHLPQLDNLNHALSLISPESRYVKMLGSDDRLEPHCVARLVEVAERHPSAGLVSSYWREGDRMGGLGLAPGSTCYPGRDVARRQLLRGSFVVGSVTTVLYRADLVRSRERFFDPGALNADTDAAYRMLRDHDLGFVHDVLCHWREDPASISGRVRDLEPRTLHQVMALLSHGQEFLAPYELARALRWWSLRYAWRYVRGTLGPDRARFRAYHRDALARVGRRWPLALPVRALLTEVLVVARDPRGALARLAGRTPGR
jgi:glycosyltransferase involved in cell wall biosynthesis